MSFANEQLEGQQIHPNHHRALQQEYYYSKKNTMHEGIEYFNDFLTTNKPQPGMDLIQFHSNIFRNIMVCRI